MTPFLPALPTFLDELWMHFSDFVLNLIRNLFPYRTSAQQTNGIFYCLDLIKDGIAIYMLSVKGNDLRSPIITVRSVHNQQIGRLWRDLFNTTLHAIFKYYMNWFLLVILILKMIFLLQRNGKSGDFKYVKRFRYFLSSCSLWSFVLKCCWRISLWLERTEIEFGQKNESQATFC